MDEHCGKSKEEEVMCERIGGYEIEEQVLSTF